MSVHRFAARRDSSEAPIIDMLKTCGFSVRRLSAKDLPDLVIGKSGITRLAECKTDNEDLTPGQVKFWAEWRGNPVIVLRTVDDVLRLSRVWALVNLPRL